MADSSISDSPETEISNIYTGQSLTSRSNSIRLVHLLPGEENDFVQCYLRTVNFDHAGHFEALSYVWGNQKDRRAILVNGKVFQVGEKLFTALSNLRKTGSERVLWIDALSINQDDLTERNDQVRKMASIYKSAKHVLAWLGLATVASRNAFDFLSRSYFSGPNGRRGLIEDHGWTAIKDLYHRDYWKRVWIVQEVCLAREVVIVCGRTQAPWAHVSELHRARKHIWTGYLSIEELDFRRSRLAHITNVQINSQTKGCSLWTLLESFRELQCHQIHDKIYGFLGLANDNSNNKMQIDYSKSVQELFEDVVKFLYHKFRQDRSSPNSGQLMAFGEFLHVYLSDHGSYNGELALPRCLISHPTVPMRLSMSAFAVLEVQGIPRADDASRLGASDLIRFLDGEVPYSHLSFWREKIDSNPTTVYPMALLVCRATLNSNIDSLVKGQRQLLNANRPSAIVAKYLRPQALMSEPGFDVVGIAPPGTCRGDMICTFVESQIALVMREILRQGSNVYRLVGRAYIDFEQLEKKLPVKYRLQSNGVIETSMSNGFREQSVTWPSTVFADMRTLQIITRTTTRQRLRRHEGSHLDIIGDPQTATQIAPSSAAFRNLHSEQLRKLEHAQQHALHRRAPAVGICNLGATGYLSCAIQILYHLKPFRDAFLNPNFVPEKKPISALQDLFRNLKRSSLPVSPSALIESFGWEVRQVNENQDFLELWRLLLQLFQKDSALSSIYIEFFELKYWQQSDQGGRLVSGEADITFEAKMGDFVQAMRKACEMGGVPAHSPNTGRYTIEFRCLPSILILQARLLEYDPKRDAMMTIRDRFEFPESFDFADVADLSDTVGQDSLYQLHGVVVLEDVNPPRWMLYLRPRDEDR